MDDVRERREVAAELALLLAGTTWPERLWSDGLLFRAAVRRVAGLARAAAWNRGPVRMAAADADELAAGVLEDLHGYRDAYRGDARVTTLLAEFVRRRVLKWLRDEGRHARRAAPLPEDAAGGDGPEERAGRAESAAALRAAFEAVGDACRALLRAFYEEGVPVNELPGRTEGESAGTTYQRVRRCREKLRAELAKRGLDVPDRRGGSRGSA